MHELITKARILVFASHDLAVIEKLCDRVIWMDKGCLIREGPPKEMIKLYKDSYLKPRKAA
jgi:ABC-type polysaccharide/polyol phosphate transport system ATPase subunit